MMVHAEARREEVEDAERSCPSPRAAANLYGKGSVVGLAGQMMSALFHPPRSSFPSLRLRVK